ncbi:MAG: hypothetical protein IJS45_11915 [Clostridia bacterium]|nr:hypothetical protein [Clostridia bacterium]
MDQKEARERRRAYALDIFVLVIAALCITALIVRVALGSDGVLPEGAPEKAEYALTFEIASQKATAGSEITNGEVLYTEDGTVFGTISSQVSVTPAKIYTEDESGRLVLTYSGSEGADANLVDIKGTINSEGYMLDYGFLAGGKVFASPGYELTLHTERVTAKVRILGITRVSE